MREVEGNCAREWNERHHRGGAGPIIQSITSFALYGFPESHAASFALSLCQRVLEVPLPGGVHLRVAE
jgi:DNA polymerase III alpha subunit